MACDPAASAAIKHQNRILSRGFIGMSGVDADRL
jgi:hypothetical protein